MTTRAQGIEKSEVSSVDLKTKTLLIFMHCTRKKKDYQWKMADVGIQANFGSKAINLDLL